MVESGTRQNEVSPGDWLATATTHQRVLCAGRDRRPGSAENLASTGYAAEVLARHGWKVTQPEFEVVGWEGGDGILVLSGAEFRLYPSPYSLGVDGAARLVAAGTLQDLNARDLEGAIVLLHGDLTAQPLTPKGFPFYRVEEHRRLIERLETAGPTAVVAATGSCPRMAGAVRPFPFIEDGDFRVPCGHVEEQVGAALARLDGVPARIRLDAQRVAGRARNVVACRGHQRGRIIVTAHVDTKVGTPGALDNAAGVTIVLLLAEMLTPRTPVGVELLVLNGEDYYNAAGEVHYLSEHGDSLEEVALAVNIDGAGYREGRTAYSLYGCEDPLATHVRTTLERRGLVEGPQWWQSDHLLFAMRGRPAVALTSELQDRILQEVIHAPADMLDQVNVALLVQAAEGLRELIERFSSDPERRTGPGATHHG